MSKLKIFAVGVCMAAITGCTTPLKLKIDVSGATSAHLRSKLVKGDKQTVPSECYTPCILEFAVDTEYRLNLEADGYYLANFTIHYNDVIFNGEGARRPDNLLLVVPLIRRPLCNGQRATSTTHTP